MAHKGHKLQFEIVAVLGLLALFTHVHLFWVAGLLLALIDIPDFSGTFTRMAGALEKLAAKPGDGTVAAPIDRVAAIKSDGHAAEVPMIVGAKPGDGIADVPRRPELAPIAGRS
jgi:hypothetical protein